MIMKNVTDDEQLYYLATMSNDSVADQLKLFFYPLLVPPMLALNVISLIANALILVSVRWISHSASSLLLLTLSLV